MILVTYEPPMDVNVQVADMFSNSINILLVCENGKDPIARKRLLLVTPECNALPEIPAAYLYFSPKAIKDIDSIIRGKKAILVSDQYSKYIAHISVMLKCPYYGNEYDTKLNSLDLILRNQGLQLSSKYKVEYDLNSTTEETVFRYHRTLRNVNSTPEYIGLDRVKEILNESESSNIQGILEPILPIANEKAFKVIDIGVEICGKTWELVASSEQCKKKMYPKLTKAVPVIKISTICKYLTESVLQAVVLAVKCRLHMDTATFQMALKDSIHWDLKYLGNFSLVDKERLQIEYRKQIPEDSVRIAFCFDQIYHSFFDYLNYRLSVLCLLQNGVTFDEWSSRGVRFQYSTNRLPFVCIGTSLADALKLFLSLLITIESVFHDANVESRHNLHEKAYPSLIELMNLEALNSKEENKANQIMYSDFKTPKTTLRKLLTPFIDITTEFKPTGAPETTETPIDSTVLKLVSLDIPSVSVMEHNPELRNPKLLTKKNRKMRIYEDQPEEKTVLLLKKLESIMESSAEDENGRIKALKWHTLINADH